jgi:hypothetical protein
MTSQKFVCFIDGHRVECFGNKQQYEIVKVSKWYGQDAISIDSIPNKQHFLKQLRSQIIDAHEFA